MHIPDGFLDVKTSALAAGLSAAGVAWAARRTRHTLGSRRAPRVGLAAAFVFAAQMVNFPILGGTSGHLVGGTLCAVLLGPAEAAVALTCVLLIQCLVFADGGLLALGANVFNMAFLNPLAGYAVYRAIAVWRPGRRGRLTAAAVAAWAATVLAAIACAAELALSGGVGWRMVLPAMAGVHALIGLGEAGITALVLAAVWRARPEWARPTEASPLAAAGLTLGAIVVLGGLVAPLASTYPDGLERVAARLGFAQREAPTAAGLAPWPDYHLGDGWPHGLEAAVVAGGGAAALFAVAWAAARVVALGARRSEADAPPPL